MFNISTDPCVVTLHFDKTSFFPGESVPIRVEIDNSKQSHPVKNVRIRLRRGLKSL